MTPTIVRRATSPRPPRFKPGTAVAFVMPQGYIVTGTFVRSFTPAKGAGLHYFIKVETGEYATILANGEQGRTVTAQKRDRA